MAAAAARAGRRFDLLIVPGLGRFLRWRHARTALQAPMLLVAFLILDDGFFGPQIAPKNVAGVVPWVHWRGLVVLALLLVSNVFCMACPFMLPRLAAKKLLPASHTWPPWRRAKWLAVGLLIVFFWAYEAFDFWASPWLTAWVVAAYFVAALTIVPVIQSFLSDVGLSLLGAPRWDLAAILPPTWSATIEALFLLLGLAGSLLAADRIARTQTRPARRARLAFLPWAVLIVGLYLAGVWLMGQPMEMRGLLTGA